MQTSRFQLGLLATLAVGLGFSLASSSAVGYPAGAAVSMGTNPIWSKGGAVGTLPGEAVITAPAGSDVIVTDVVLSYRDTNCYPTVYLSNGAGEELARFAFYLNMSQLVSQCLKWFLGTCLMIIADIRYTKQHLCLPAQAWVQPLSS